MPQVYPFRAVRYSRAGDVSAQVAPPYDVIDAGAKARLLGKDASNIVGIDLPHTPAKELGPPSAYSKAAADLREFLRAGTLAQDAEPAMFAYRQTFRGADGRTTIQRSGMCCTVEMTPFGPRAGGGMLPHEETFSGPKEDRMALMRATKMQLSPIFGLHADDRGRATTLLRSAMSGREPDQTAVTEDGTRHEVWRITDARMISAYQEALSGEDVFIADGHHRYTTGLNYLRALEAEGAVPADHPARRCMIVLVGMSDPGLVIWPTHRVLGGMRDYSLEAFQKAAKGVVNLKPFPGDLAGLDRELALSKEGSFGLWDFATRTAFLASPSGDDPLAARFADKPRAWRDLTVAFVQHMLVERVCQGELNGGQSVKWAFPHTVAEVEEIGRGAETGAGGGTGFAQLAVIVKPTPLAAVREVSCANQLMPQKSTFFYPKLATGLFLNPLSMSPGV